MPTAAIVIDGKYRLLRPLGEGATGVVYEAEHVLLRKRVALKLLRRELAGQELAIARFEQEAVLAARLEHDNIVRVTDFGAADGGLYLVMDLLVGRTLGAELRRGRLARERAIEIGIAVLRGLEAAHAAGVVHRDLKPENVFLVDAAEGRPAGVKLLDFGIAKLLGPESARVTGLGMVVGTPLYMSPEQARGEADIDPRADVHAVGAMLYEMLAGRTPYVGENANLVTFAILSGRPPDLAKVAPEVPRELAELVMKAIAPDRARRIQSARELREALERWLEQKPQAAPVASSSETALDLPIVVVAPSAAKKIDPTIEIHVEPPLPVWRAPAVPPEAVYLAPTPPPPQPAREEHAAVARPLPIDERSRRNPAISSGAPAGYVHPAVVLTANARAGRRRALLVRLLLFAIALAAALRLAGG